MIKFTHKIANCSVEDDQRGVSVYLNICLKAEEILYNPRGPAPCPAATILEIQTPKLSSNRPQGPVLVSDCFLIYLFQLETNRREYVPLSKLVGAPVPGRLPPTSLHHKPWAGRAFLFCYHSSLPHSLSPNSSGAGWLLAMQIVASQCTYWSVFLNIHKHHNGRIILS